MDTHLRLLQAEQLPFFLIGTYPLLIQKLRWLFNILGLIDLLLTFYEGGIALGINLQIGGWWQYS
jgi:hypothetical protein